MRHLALALFLAGGCGGARFAATNTIDPTGNETYCDVNSCGGTGSALGVGLVGVGLLVGFAAFRELFL